MNFEDTGFNDNPLMRRAFLLAEMDAMGRVIVEDNGTRRQDTADLQIRTATILKEKIPGADDQLVAGALLFLTHAFARSGAMMMGRSGDDQLMPKVAEWSAEWQDIQKGRKGLDRASEGLRQILTAADAARLENYSNQFAKCDQFALRRTMMERDMMAMQMGDINAPDLQAFSKDTRDMLNRQLNGEPEPSPTPPAVSTGQPVKFGSPLKFKKP